MGRFAALLYGLACYLTVLFAFVYAIGFVGNLIVPKSIDSGPTGPILVIPPAPVPRAATIRTPLGSAFSSVE